MFRYSKTFIFSSGLPLALVNMFKAEDNDFSSDKIIGFGAAVKKISEFKQANKTVGLCHGGFDLLHPGHIKHLESAAKLCDYLFVSITSDRFVTARKGSGRPIFSELLRAYSVAALNFVDFVVVSDFERAVHVVERLKPSFYIKGPDFVNKTTPGITAERRAIEAAGGEVKYTADQKFSSTEIINHIKDNVKREKILLVIDRDGTLVEHVDFLGRDENWMGQVKLQKPVIDLISYVQTKYDTVKIVISNQQGVARNYFALKTVADVNGCIAEFLREKGVVIDNWQFCPDVDKVYAASANGVQFNPDFVKDKAMRKPSPGMVLQALKELNMTLGDFDMAVVIGDSRNDAELAENINAEFIDVNSKSYEAMKKEFSTLL